MNWDRLVEQKLREAREEGKFDNLPGYGKPLNLDENPFEDPAWQAAHQLLKQGGFRPDWLEEDAGLRAQLGEAREALRRSLAWRQTELRALADRVEAEALERRKMVAYDWRLAEARFRETPAKINHALTSHNLKVPNERFQRLKLDIELEFKKIVGGS
jgi:DnaJ family protein C protein 28